ncbi:hypothetical protein VTJ49DRAFT_6159 [Mycothermus thermophilus]|uniref:Nuclear pore assembly and biogenesis-domain-containing protein n=1 Tax=Humicola insolens TaxID=85995 RepID=A0ABR3V2U6_HUMIN
MSRRSGHSSTSKVRFLFYTTLTSSRPDDGCTLHPTAPSHTSILTRDPSCSQTDYLPPDTTLPTTLYTLFLSPSSPLQTALRTLTSAISTLTTHLVPVINALLDRAATLFSSTSPDILALASLLLLTFLAWQLLSLVRRIIAFWTRLVFRLFFWAVIGSVVAMAWQRGVEQTARDAVVVGAKVAGWMVGVAQTWWEEFEKAQEVQGEWRRYQQQQQQQQQYGGGYAGQQRAQGSGWGYYQQGRGR